MTSAPTDVPMPQSSSSSPPWKSCTEPRLSNVRGVQWRINLGILPSSPSSLVEDLRRVAADSRRKYASLRRRLLIDPHLPKDGNRSPNLFMDNPLSQNPDSMWGRFFRNAELEKMVDQDLSRLYPEKGSYFQTPACQAMLRRILLLWCLRHPEYGYRQGMHELLAPLLYVLHADVQCLVQVRKLYEDHFCDEYDGKSFPEGDLVSNYRFTKNTNWDTGTNEENAFQGSTAKVSSLDELDPDTRNIILLNDAYGAEGELGILLSERFMEHDAYCMFDALMNGAHGVVAMADFFSPSPAIGSSTSLPPVIEASSALYHLLSIVDSSLHSHLVELGVEPQYFALRWLRVLFGREFSLDDLLVIWDEIFSSPNGIRLAADNDAQYNFKVLCSPRGAFISAMAVSMLLHLRSSLLATENATSCLQRLLNFPGNINVMKLIEKAKSLQALALDTNISSSTSWEISDRNKSEFVRAYSLSSGSVSPKTPLSTLPDSYWEEKWRVLHRAEELKKGSQSDSKSTGIIKGSLGRLRGSLSRTESEPSPAKSGGGKNDSRSSVRRRLLDDLSHEVNSEVDLGKSGSGVLNLSGTKEPLPVEVEVENDFPDDATGQHIMERNLSVEVEVEKDFPEEPTGQHIMERNLDFMAEETCLSGENSSVFSTATSPLSMTNDHENDSENSVTSNSCNDDNADETQTLEEQCSNNSSDLQLRDSEAISATSKPAPANTDVTEKQAPVLKERKLSSGKFQWFWKFGRGGGEGNPEKGGIVESQASMSKGDSHRVNSASDGCCSSCGFGREEVGDKRVLGAMRNLGQSMLENVQVIESALQQEGGQVGSSENLSNNMLGGKGQVTAMAALKELRRISNLLSEM